MGIQVLKKEELMGSYLLEIKNYKSLNTFAKKGGCVFLGSGADKYLPVSAIADACQFNFPVYNRSASSLSILDASTFYDTCVKAVEPESLILHLGGNDIELLKKNPSLFDRSYIAFIAHIRECNPKTRIALVSCSDAELNRHLRALCDSEKCVYCDETRPKVWNPQTECEVSSFMYSQGFTEMLRVKKPLRNIADLFFAYMNVFEPEAEFESMSQVS